MLPGLAWRLPVKGKKLVLELNISVRKTWDFLNLGKDTALDVKLSVPQTELASFQIPIGRFVENLVRRSPAMPPFVLPGRREEPPFTPRLVLPSLGEGGSHSHEARACEVGLIDNLRGRPLESFGPAGFDDQRSSQAPREEELIFIAGTILEPPDKSTELEEGCPEESQEPHPVPFYYRAVTRFHSFTRSGHIQHMLSVSASENIKDAILDFQPPAISRLLPETIEQVRFGFESYRTRFLGSMFGTIPTIEGRFYLAATSSLISIFLEEAAMRKKGQLPLEEAGIIAALDHACTDVGILHGLSEQLRERL
jgi:hypothetical protein